MNAVGKNYTNLKERKTKEQSESETSYSTPAFLSQTRNNNDASLSKEGYNSNINYKYSSYFIMTMHQRTILVRMKYDYQYSDTHGKNRRTENLLH